MRFFPREKGKTAFSEKNAQKMAVFPFSRGKNRISQGVENRGSLISVPLALRAVSELRGWQRRALSRQVSKGARKRAGYCFESVVLEAFQNPEDPKLTN